MKKLLITAFIFSIAGFAQSATYTVTNNGDSGTGGTLREAITLANATVGYDTILFQIEPTNFLSSIVVTSALPIISDTLFIDGYSQATNNLPGIQLDGSSLTGSEDGLSIQDASDCVIRGFVINGFPGSGIVIASPGSGNSVYGNYIGVDTNATVAIPNGAHGITISGGTSNFIGSAPINNPYYRNILSGNASNGLYLVSATYSTILNNFIGTDRLGLSSIPNGHHGIGMRLGGVNLVGSTNVAERPQNIISGNATNGITMQSSTANSVQGNYIGVDVNGTNALANGADGIEMISSVGNIVGSVLSIGNVISGNGDDGVVIGTNSSSTYVYGNFIGVDANGINAISNGDNGVAIIDSVQNVIGNSVVFGGNIISGNGTDGVLVRSSDGNGIQNNYIGLNSTGTNVVRNGEHGVEIEMSSSGNGVGGGSSFTANYIAGNGTTTNHHGVMIQSFSHNNTVLRNAIGMDILSAAKPNAGDGIHVINAGTNTLGGTDTLTPNYIVANGDDGIEINGPFAGQNNILYNRIGVTPTAAAMGNSGYGIKIVRAPGTSIGATNVPTLIVSANSKSGLYIGDSTSARNSSIVNAYIGVDPTGTNDMGNGEYGIHIEDSPGNSIGSQFATNIIAGNALDGIRIEGSTAVDNVMVKNYIGADLQTNALANGNNGIWIGNNASSNTVGGVSNVFKNVIAHNSHNGVVVESGTNNLIRYNSIYNNGLLGIDLGEDGVTTNDVGDFDSGANNLQNYPVFVAATTGGPTALTFSGELYSQPSTTCRVDIYISDAADPSGYGEGQNRIGTTNLVTDTSGYIAFTNITMTTIVPLSTSKYITAIATDPFGNTSEFSPALQLQGEETYDGDSDEIPDAWEEDHGGDLDPDADTDGDGYDGLDEYTADTDPTDTNSFLRIVEIARTNSTEVTYTSTNSRYYLVYYGTDIVNNVTWTNLIYYPATLGSNDMTTAYHTNTTQLYFYKVAVQTNEF